MPAPAKKAAKTTVTTPVEKPVKAAVKSPAKAPAEIPAKAAVSDAKKAAPAKTGNKKKSSKIAPEQRRNYVEIAAYYIAERHGFTLGRDAADWVEAEAEIDRLLGEGHFNP